MIVFYPVYQQSQHTAQRCLLIGLLGLQRCQPLQHGGHAGVLCGLGRDAGFQYLNAVQRLLQLADQRCSLVFLRVGELANLHDKLVEICLAHFWNDRRGHDWCNRRGRRNRFRGGDSPLPLKVGSVPARIKKSFREYGPPSKNRFIAD